MKKKNIVPALFLVGMFLSAPAFTACNGKPANGHTHNWSATYAQEDDRHYQICNGCNKKNYAYHNYGTSGICVCGKQKPEQHTHAYSSEWTYDEDYHWYAAVCEHTNEIKDKAVHDFTIGNCICGKTKPVIETAGLSYILNQDGESYVVTGIGTATDTDIVIPSEYNGKPVTNIANYAFHGNTSIESLIIPDSVKYIGNWAFKECNSLTRLTIGCGIIAFDPEVFKNCPVETASIPAIACSHIETASLKELKITSGTSIPDSVFKGSTELISLTIGNTVASIGNKAFQNCRSLTSVVIPDSVEFIGSYAFDGCISLSDITADAQNSNYSSRDGILYNKAKTEFVHIPKAITGSVTIPDGIASINYLAFSNCRNLTEIIIPNTVLSIEWSAFYNCTELKSIKIPGTLTFINDEAFADCAKLEVINFNGTTEQWNAVTKGYNWDVNTGSYTVHCTDGDIAKIISGSPTPEF